MSITVELKDRPRARATGCVSVQSSAGQTMWQMLRGADGVEVT